MASTSQDKKDPLPSTRDQSPPDSAYMSEPATLEVGSGESKHNFYIHRDFLLFYSGYFKGVLNGGFAETHSGITKLEIEEPAVFEGFIKWLYTRKARKDQIDNREWGEYYTSIVKL